MSSLSNIRNRLYAVKNIKQIATSMEMVASARFRKAQERAKQTQFYVTKISEILSKLFVAANDCDHPLFKPRVEKKIGLLIVCSDRGLCGAYNSNILSAADRFLQSHGENVELILLGRKAVNYYHQRKRPTIREWIQWSNQLDYTHVSALSEFILEAFISHQFDALWLLYTKFHNLMHRELTLEKFLPIEKPESHDSQSLNYLYEPNRDEILNELLPRYLTAKIESVLNQAYASELSARIFAMKAAANNAEEMIDSLTLERNKMRQAGITREILETIST